ncbi:probable ATP-dependent DNA helicase HFM1 [Patiria miniata]|uniref:Probable ATP-dependent DNA helicase HFM1 n=1 Tax=Patiria miniata TaxID=46514 RepID=A0A913ZST7_PATMI|nr:probable ATP-dependent DNA helicase HFM1 [Patiria miniata]
MFHNTTRGKQATVRPFIKHQSSAVPVPPSSASEIFGSQSFREDDDYDDDEIDITASQLIRESNFKVPTAPRGILKRSSYPARRDHLEESFFGSQSGLFDESSSHYEDPNDSPAFDLNDDEDLFGSQHGLASQQPFSQSEDLIPSSQPVRHGQRFIPSFTPKRVRIADAVTSQVTNSTRPGNHDIYGSQTPALVQESPYGALDIPGFTTPGGTTHSGNKLRSVTEIPKQYRSVFPFPYFNIVQSKVLDDVLYTDKHMVVCAPTGSGKTAVFELAIVHLLIAMGANAVKAKIVYMAPIKALCSQRCQDWKDKFEPLGLKCQELTGDTELDDYFQLQEVNIVMTTPEKWDSMTRKWRDNKCLVQLLKLFLIDEVHSLNEENRGATVEAVISRMKTVQAAVVRETTTNEKKQGEERTPELRFLAVSATIPNIEDVAKWLETGGNHAVYHKLDESHRPVKLRKVVLSYPCSERMSEFRFGLSLNYKLSGVIHTYSDQKPTLVFCATRKGVQQSASILVKEARFIMNAQHRQRLQKMANMVREIKLRELLLNGVAFHHAGLDAQDRKFIEDLFISGDIPVLFATSTLAMGVNLPAHLVVVKSTQHYVSGMYCEYTETQILQMIGRAGRPQFDTTATAVIMTKHDSKRKYEALLNGADDIESSLHNHLIEHLNAEIVLHTINDISIALEWLKSTFLYIRIMKNPSHYGIPTGLSKEQMEKKLQDMCIRDLNLLSNFGLVKMDPETMDLKPLETGRLMARYCIAFDTMKQFSEISGTESTEDLMTMLCQCKEFSDIQLRVNERKILNTLNKDKNRVTIRFPMKGKIKTTDMKVNCLVQSTLGCLPIQDFGLAQDCTRIFRAGQRLTRCLLEYLMQRNNFQVLLHATVIAKCFQARLWENSKNVVRQIDKIGPALGTALVNAGIVNFQKLESTNPRELELILNRHPPFGNQILDAVTHLPKYDVSIEQAPRYNAHSAEITVTITLINQEKLSEKQTAKRNHCCLLLIGDADNGIVYKQRITDMQLLRGGPWCKRIEVRRANKAEELSVNLVSQDYVGLDVQNTYTPFYSGPKHLRTAAQESSSSQPKKQPAKNTKLILKRRQSTPMNSSHTDQWLGSDNDPKTDEEDLFEFGNRKPCSHRCSDKDTCAHECCKFGVLIRHRPQLLETPRRDRSAGQRQSGQSSAAASTTPSTAGQMPRLSRLERYFSELHAKADELETPTVKRIKVAQGSNNTCNVDLDKFAFTPKSKPSVPATLSSSAATPSLTPKLNPHIPATPTAAKGWEMLDMYQQAQCQEMSEEQQMEEFEDQSLNQATSVWTDDPWINNLDNFDMSWSDSDKEEMVLDRYVQGGDEDFQNDLGLLSDHSPPLPDLYRAEPAIQNLQQQYNHPEQQQHSSFYNPAINKNQQQHQKLGQQPRADISQPATGQNQQHLDPGQQQRLSSLYRPATSQNQQLLEDTAQHHNPKQNLNLEKQQLPSFYQPPTSQYQHQQPDVEQQRMKSIYKQAANKQNDQEQQQLTSLYRPATSHYQQRQHPGKQLQPPSIYKSVSTNHYQAQQSRPQPSSTPVPRRRGQVFAWKSPTSRPQTGYAPVIMRFSSNAKYNAGNFVSAKTALASMEPSTSAQLPSTTKPRSNVVSATQDKEMKNAYKTKDTPSIEPQSPSESREENVTVSSSDSPIIVLSDEETTLDISNNSHPYIMNSSSDEEFLLSCLEVESQEANKVQNEPRSVKSPSAEKSKESPLQIPRSSPSECLFSQISSLCGSMSVNKSAKQKSFASSHSNKSSLPEPRPSLNMSIQILPESCNKAPEWSTGQLVCHMSPLPPDDQQATKPIQSPSLGVGLQIPSSSNVNKSMGKPQSTDTSAKESSQLTQSLHLSVKSSTPKSLSHKSSTFTSNQESSQLFQSPPNGAKHSSQASNTSTKSPNQESSNNKVSACHQEMIHLTPQPSVGVSLSSPPSSSSGSRSSLWGRKLCSPLLRRQKTRDFFTANPDKSPKGADDAKSIYDKLFEGIF